MYRVRVIHGDITKIGDHTRTATGSVQPGLRLDAIVNAANERLLGGGGVDGAIHRAAGPELLAECRRIPEVSPGVRCPVGSARITKAYGLAARHIIHTVGPVWFGGRDGEENLLASCYRECLKLAQDNAVKTLAFPAISCGVYRFPPERAAIIVAEQLHAAQSTCPDIEDIYLVAFEKSTAELLQTSISHYANLARPN